MKKYVFIFVLTLSAITFSQLNDRESYEQVFLRIEQAFKNASPGNLWPFISSPITIRIEDSLYQNISDIYTESLLKKFFENKDSVSFRFDGKFYHSGSAKAHGVIIYIVNNKRISLNVDVYLDNWRGEVIISALNISNYPSSTAFYKKWDKTK